MARTCSACGRANDEDARFCQACGAPLTPPPPGPDRTGEQPNAPVTPAGAPAAPPPGPPPGAPHTPPPGPPQGPPTGTPQRPPSGQPQNPAAGAPPGAPPVSPPPAGPPPEPSRKGKPAPRWLVALVIVAIVVLVAVMAFAFIPRGGGGGDDKSPTPAPTAAVTVPASPSPGLGVYLAAATGPKADRLAAILHDGTVLPVTRFAGQQIWQIAYSPDGKWLACIAGTYRRSELWVFDTATGDARQATADAPDIVAVDSVAWLSSGELLAAGYTETPKFTGQNADFLVYDLATGEFSPLTGSGGVALRGVSVSASGTGDKVAYVTYTDQRTNKYGMPTANELLEVLDRASGETTQLGKNKALFDVNARAFDHPVISPNGQAIIYRRAGSDVGTSYTVIGTDGTMLMPAKEAMMPAGYAWSPEGTKVVFTGQPISSSGNQAVTFWLFDTQAGGAPTVLARYAHTTVQDLAWSPDGSTIAWAEYDRKRYQTGTIYLMPATGGDSTPLARNALSPAWAPDAKEPLQTSPSP
jgi:Tol biopolymer transport system component